LITRSGCMFYPFVKSLSLTPDSCYVFSGSLTDSTGKSFVFLSKVKNNCDTVWFRIYADSVQLSGKGSWVNKDGSIIITGEKWSNQNSMSQILLIKTDSSGNIIWKKDFSGSLEGGNFCFETLEGNYLTTAVHHIDGFHTEARLIKTDSSGGILWSRYFYTNGYNDGSSYTSQFPDSTFLHSCSNNPGSGVYKTTLRKLSKNGDTLWSKVISDNNDCLLYPVNTLQGKRSFFCSGSVRDSLGPCAAIFSFDSLGNELWRRYFRHDTIGDFYPSHCLTTPDKGFVLCGGSGGNGQDAWIVKVDSLGCEVSGCDAIGMTEFDGHGVMAEVYPNPATDYIEISVETGIIVEMQLMDISGKILLSKSSHEGERIDVAHIEAGCYFLRIRDNDGNSITKPVVIAR
jgi:hypothetical protein